MKGKSGLIKLTSIILAILIYFPLVSQDYPGRNFPKYEYIVRKFFRKYSVDTFSNTAVKFEKRKEGWVVRGIRSVADTIFTELFWSISEKHFLPCRLPKYTSQLFENYNKNQYLDRWTIETFNTNPYFGYMGWDKDAIGVLENRDDLNDTLLYRLGRAYSSYAGNLLNNYSGESDPNTRFNLQEKKNCLTEEQLALFRKFEYKSIACFEKVISLNPAFETIVGDIMLKTANEYMNLFLTVWMYQNEKEALKDIPEKPIYTDFYIAFAKNLLNSCEKNAVLFTNGDTDTYPLLYVQEKLNFRRDVMVVNISLLSTSRYISHLRDPVIESAPFELSFMPSDYTDGTRDYLLIRKTENYLDAANVFSSINQDSNITFQNETTMHYFPTNRFRISEEVKWEIPSTYILKNKFILFNHLAFNRKRPVYFVCTMENDFHSEIDHYLVNEGLVYRFEHNYHSEPFPEYYNAQMARENLLSRYEWKGLNQKITSNAEQLGYNYSLVFFYLANHFLESGDKNSAKEIMKKHSALFPPSVLTYDEKFVLAVSNYLALDEPQTALEIARRIVPVIHRLDERWKESYFNYLRSLAGKYKSYELMEMIPEEK